MHKDLCFVILTESGLGSIYLLILKNWSCYILYMSQTVLLSCISPFLPLEQCLPLLRSDQGVSSTTLARCAKGLTGNSGSSKGLTDNSGSTCSGAADSGNIQLCPCSPKWICPVTRWGKFHFSSQEEESCSILPLLRLTECSEA